MLCAWRLFNVIVDIYSAYGEPTLMLLKNFVTPPAAHVKSNLDAAQAPAAEHSITKLFGGFDTLSVVIAHVDGQSIEVVQCSLHVSLVFGPAPPGPAVGIILMIGGIV